MVCIAWIFFRSRLVNMGSVHIPMRIGFVQKKGLKLTKVIDVELQTFNIPSSSSLISKIIYRRIDRERNFDECDFCNICPSEVRMSCHFRITIGSRELRGSRGGKQGAGSPDSCGADTVWSLCLVG